MQSIASMTAEEIVAVLPPLSHGQKEDIHNTTLNDSKYMFCKWNKRQKEYVYQCSHCEKIVSLDLYHPEHKEKVHCPNCQSLTILFKSGFGKQYLSATGHYLAFSTYENTCFFSAWECVRSYTDNDTGGFPTGETTYSLKAVYPMQQGLMLKIKPGAQYYRGKWRNGHKLIKSITPPDEYGFYADESITEEKLKGTCLEHSQLHVLENTCCSMNAYITAKFKYLPLYLKTPIVEVVVSTGNLNLYHDMANNSRTKRNKVFDFSKRKAKDILRLKDNREVIFATENHWTMKMLQAYQMFASKKMGTIEVFEKDYKADLVRIIESDRLDKQDKVDWVLIRYLHKMRVSENHEAGMCAVIVFYKDYLKMAEELGIDTDCHYNRYPKDLMGKHDEYARIISENKKAREEQLATDTFEKLKKCTYQDDTYIIRPAMSEQEIIDEGKTLQHCVGGGSYYNAHIQGSSYIFFMRKVDAPNIPLYTTQIAGDLKRIIQNHGYNNDRDNPKPEAVRAFTDKWLRYIEQLKKTKPPKQKEVA